HGGRARERDSGRVPQRPSRGGALDRPCEGAGRGARRGGLSVARRGGLAGLQARTRRLRAVGRNLRGKLDTPVAIVTGAAQGIGKAVADKLADEGASVVGADLQDGVAMQVDVSKEEGVRQMVPDRV